MKKEAIKRFWICADCEIDESINIKDNKNEILTLFAGWKIYKDLLKNLDTAGGRARFIVNMEREQECVEYETVGKR